MYTSQFDETTFDLVGDLFEIFEQAKEMFNQWDSTKHLPFIQQVMKLQAVEEKLYRLGYDESFVGSLVKTVYESVFSSAERRQYSGNWHIVV